MTHLSGFCQVPLVHQDLLWTTGHHSLKDVNGAILGVVVSPTNVTWNFLPRENAPENVHLAVAIHRVLSTEGHGASDTDLQPVDIRFR